MDLEINRSISHLGIYVEIPNFFSAAGEKLEKSVRVLSKIYFFWRRKRKF